MVAGRCNEELLGNNASDPERVTACFRSRLKQNIDEKPVDGGPVIFRTGTMVCDLSRL